MPEQGLNIELSLGEDRQLRGLPGHRAVKTTRREEGRTGGETVKPPHPQLPSLLSLSYSPDTSSSHTLLPSMERLEWNVARG